MSDQLRVVFNERAELEEKVRFMTDSNEGKERIIEMLSQQSDREQVCERHNMFDKVQV